MTTACDMALTDTLLSRFSIPLILVLSFELTLIQVCSFELYGGTIASIWYSITRF